jgi:hypothetical protein
MKKLIIAVVGLLIVVTAGLAFLWSNLDEIVKDAIQTYGSEATKTQVSVANVKLKLESGYASISGLNVGNPSGFSDPNIFELGEISVKVDTSTINQNPIIIDEITIKAPTIVYEINKSGVSNIDVLKKNLGIKTSSSERASDGDELKMIIRKLVVESSKAQVKIAALGNAERSVSLPRIQLTDVGKKSGGATAAEVAQILSSKLLGNVKSSVTKIGVSKYLGKGANSFKKDVLDNVGNIGGVGGAAGDAMKGLFGK